MLQYLLLAIAPIRTIPTIRTISSNVVVINRTTATTSTSSVTGADSVTSVTSAGEENTNTPNNSESGDNLTLIYALVPTGILALILILLFIRRKRAINNNNVVNIDLNIENVIPTNDTTNNTVKQSSVNSARFSTTFMKKQITNHDMKCLQSPEPLIMKMF